MKYKIGCLTVEAIPTYHGMYGLQMQTDFDGNAKPFYIPSGNSNHWLKLAVFCMKVHFSMEADKTT